MGSRSIFRVYTPQLDINASKYLRQCIQADNQIGNGGWIIGKINNIEKRRGGGGSKSVFLVLGVSN